MITAVENYGCQDAFFLAENDIVIHVGDAFLSLTEYRTEEILYRSVNELLKCVLRMTCKFNQQSDIYADFEGFLFTGSLEPREVYVSVSSTAVQGQYLYLFEEIPNSRLNYKFPHLCAINHYGTSGVAIFLAKPQIILLQANQEFLSFFDSPYNKKENTIGRRIDQFVTDWKGSSSDELWRNLLETGEPFFSEEYEYNRFNKGIRYYQSSMTPIKEKGSIKYVIEMTNDITDKVKSRQHIEEQARIIKEQNQQLEAIIEHMSDGLLVFDKNGRYILKNNAANSDSVFSVCEKVADSYMPSRYFDLDGKELSYHELPFSRVFTGERIIEQRLAMNTEQGMRYMGVSGTPILDDSGNSQYGIMCIRDITESFKHSLIIKEQKEQLQAIMDNMQEAMFIFDRFDQYILINKTGRSLFPCPLQKLGDAIKYMKFYDIDGIELAFEDTPEYRVKIGETIKGMILMVKFDGGQYYFNTSGKPIFDDRGQLQYGIVLIHDVTDFIRSEMALKESQERILKAETLEKEALRKAIEMKDEFISFITHEFKTPLAVINSAIQAIEYICHNEISGKLKGFLDKIRQNSFRQLRLVNNLLDITRINAGRFTIHRKNLDIVFLAREITGSVSLYAQQKGVKLSFSSTISKKILGIDEEKFERILLNLLSNAIKFTPKGNSVYVHLSQINKHQICLEVKDEGVGIPKEKQSMIFERFGQVDSNLTRQAEGTGIGLSLVKMLVQALNGEIVLKSQVSEGSSFKVYLPAEKVKENTEIKQTRLADDSRLVYDIAIEFSDIYF